MNSTVNGNFAFVDFISQWRKEVYRSELYFFELTERQTKNQFVITSEQNGIEMTSGGGKSMAELLSCD